MGRTVGVSTEANTDRKEAGEETADEKPSEMESMGGRELIR
jgi:hypothetical protein